MHNENLSIMTKLVPIAAAKIETKLPNTKALHISLPIYRNSSRALPSLAGLNSTVFYLELDHYQKEVH